MDIYLAGKNGKSRILTAFIGGGYSVYDTTPEQIINYKKSDMEIYLSGTVSAGNMRNEWKKLIQNKGNEKDSDSLLSPVGEKTFCVLESFYYISTDDILIPLIPYFKKFMLDSGAFSFMQGNGSRLNFDEYLEKYIAFINQYNIDLFYELDIDSVVGYEKVKEYRRRLEKGTGKQCIPVWHKSRGKLEFQKLCDEYPYIGLGGIAAKEFTKDEYRYFPWFINEAHKRNCKIHGLGFTNTTLLHKYHFDSVDSSSWTTGNRFGAIYKFKGENLIKIQKPQGMKVKSRETAVNNFIEWVKYANWAETHL